MESLIVFGGKELNGEIEVDSAKNAVLPILAGCILCEGVVVLHNVTFYEDVLNMIKILESLGAKVIIQDKTLIIDSRGINSFIIPVEYSSKLRASFFCLGPLLARLKKARVSYPGGCAIGIRPIDIHTNGLKSLGAKIIDIHGFITTNGNEMKAGKVRLNFPSVGATENLIMASVFLKGTTKIYGCAKEPEVVDLCKFLNKMGAKIKGYGSDVISVTGVKKLGGGEYTPIPDRIIAGTYLMLPLIAGGKLHIKNAKKEHLGSLIDILRNNSCNIDVKNDMIKIEKLGRQKGFGKIETMPYPFFPTDLQQQLTSLACVSDGSTIIVENLFENRFKQTFELVKMGAKIVVKDRVASIEGVNRLFGAEVNATDLRGGVSLVMAGLCAGGYTKVNNCDIIDRGYFKLEEKLSSLGALVLREKG